MYINKYLNSKKNNLNRGLTILEFIIYFAITLVLIGVMVVISINIFSNRERVKLQQEILRSGNDVMNHIVNDIISADEFVGLTEKSVPE